MMPPISKKIWGRLNQIDTVARVVFTNRQGGKLSSYMKPKIGVIPPYQPNQKAEHKQDDQKNNINSGSERHGEWGTLRAESPPVNGEACKT